MTTETPTQVHERLVNHAMVQIEAGNRLGWLTNMVVLEQKALASARMRLCIECDAPATCFHAPGPDSLLKSTGYYMCRDCEEYWEAKQ
jgi:hypothetical protein